MTRLQFSELNMQAPSLAASVLTRLLVADSHVGIAATSPRSAS